MAQLQLRIEGRFGYRSVQLIKSEENSLGIGSYGAVYKAKCDQLPCAAKILHPILFSTRDPASQRIVQRFEQECQFLSEMRHPNIIQYLGTCRDPESRLPVLFMELMDHSLTSFLEQPDDPPPLPFHIQVNIAYDVAQALVYLHSHEILHRDLSSNNVLLIGSSRAKVTDFGMARLMENHPHLTPTFCPGTMGYMSPEALREPPAYTTKLDIFSCGVLHVQLITRKFPDPGPRTQTVELQDPRYPSSRVLIEVPELERRKSHIDLIDPTHPLLVVALGCLKDKEGERPSAEQLCSRLAALKETTRYQESPRQVQEQTVPQSPHGGELQQQLRDQVEELRQQVQQLQLQSGRKEEEVRQNETEIRRKEADIRQKNGEIQRLQHRFRQNEAEIHRKDAEVQRLQRELQQTSRDSEQLVATLQQSLEQKDEVIRSKDNALQEKERQIRELQQSQSDRRSGSAPQPLRLQWRDGPKAPFGTYGHSVAVSEGMAYFVDGVSDTKILIYNSETGQWTILPECPKRYFSIAVVNGLLTAIGGKQSDQATKSLLSLTTSRALFGLTEQQKWTEHFPPMKYHHNNPSVACTGTSLIVAGGWGPDKEKAPVEVMDTKTSCWSEVASLPHVWFVGMATICGGRMYMGGGVSSGNEWSKSVLMCEVHELLQSTATQRHSQGAGPRDGMVWRQVAELPVKQSALVTIRGQLLALGGCVTGGGSDDTSEVRQYDTATNSWKDIGHMKIKRRYFFAAVLPSDQLMVVGGRGPKDSVEIASLV